MNFNGLIFLYLTFRLFMSQLLFKQNYGTKGSHKHGRKRRPTAGAPVQMAGIFSAARATRPRHPHCPDPVSSRQQFVIRSLRYSSNPIVTLVNRAKCRFIGGERVNSFYLWPPVNLDSYFWHTQPQSVQLLLSLVDQQVLVFY